MAKLIGKIGPVTSATIKGNHVWGHSVLTITNPDAVVEHWKTRQIVNVSKLGKLFNQWPTRKTEHRHMTRHRAKAGSRNHPVTDTVGGAFDTGKSGVQDLLEQMEEWASNLESNNMEHLPKYEEVCEARDTLQNAIDSLEGIEVPEAVDGVEVTYTIDTRHSARSRGGQMSNALAALDAAKSAAQDWLDSDDGAELDHDPENPESPTEEEVDERQAACDKVEGFINDNGYCEAEGVSFPGMY